MLATACATHFLHDGFADILYVFLPVWAREFGLSFAEVGVIRTAYTGGMALFQMPAGLLASAGTSGGCWRSAPRSPAPASSPWARPAASPPFW